MHACATGVTDVNRQLSPGDHQCRTATTDPEEIKNKLSVDTSMTSLARAMRSGPSRRVHRSLMRRLAWGAVAIGLLPWAASVIAIRTIRWPRSLDQIAAERPWQAMIVSATALVVGLVASLMADKEDLATRHVASIAVVLASCTILLAGATLLSGM